jgi:hypothetical protein
MMASPSLPTALLLLLLATTSAPTPASAQLTLSVSTTAPVAHTGPYFAPAFGWEMWAMLGMLESGDLTDTRLIKAASSLAGSPIRVGGITCDWVRYVIDSAGDDGSTLSSAPPRRSAEDIQRLLDGPRRSHNNNLGDFWPTAPENITTTQWRTLYDFFAATGMKLLFDLNELYGRDCNTTNPGNGQPNWCVGAWDTSNVEAFLQWVHDEGLYSPSSPSSPLIGFELGNELVTHLDAGNNTADILTLAGIIKRVWSDVPASAVPPFVAPSTDSCTDPGQLSILDNTGGQIAAFSYHAYPGQSGVGNVALDKILLNQTWLRQGIMTGSASASCIARWNETGGSKSKGTNLWVTESSSSWAWDLPAPAQNAFIHSFFTIPELGQYATTGVGMVARWSFSEGSPFGTLVKNGTRWDAASDYFILLAFSETVGMDVLAVSGDDGSDALVYAACTAAGAGGIRPSGSLTLYAVNVGAVPITLSPTTASSSSPIPLTPRLEYVFTAPGGNLSSTTPVLNGNEASPLRLADDGSAPPMPGKAIPAGDPATVLTLPPYSAGFFVLLGAGAAACS